jgi:hypothetical protein
LHGVAAHQRKHSGQQQGVNGGFHGASFLWWIRRTGGCRAA